MDYFQDQKIKIAFQILKDHGAAEVYLFGSQASGNVCRDSDYDFGVKGFPPEIFYSALIDLEYAIKSKVDLIDFDFQPVIFDHLLKNNSIVRLETG